MTENAQNIAEDPAVATAEHHREAPAPAPAAAPAAAPAVGVVTPGGTGRAPAGKHDPKTFRDKPVSFVRRSGRMTSGQQKAWDEFSPSLLIDVQRGGAATSVAESAEAQPAEMFGRDADLVVEIGSGQGHAIVHAATNAPEKNFLAVEVFRAGLARTMSAAEAGGLTNVRMVEANAPEVLEYLLPEGSASEVWVFFPDPWTKVRHMKRRLVSADFTKIVARALRPGGVLRLATDWEEYAEQMRDVLDAAPGFSRDFSGEWAQRFDGRVETAFERKGKAKGRAIRDLAYRRK